MKNNVLVVLLIILVGIFSGLALLLSFNNILQLAVTPVTAHLNQIQVNERIIINKLNKSTGTGDNGDLNSRLEAIENQLKNIDRKLGSARPQAPQPPSEDMNKVHTIDIGSAPIKGKKDAPITIVQFTDLQCPFCARFYPPLNEVFQAYPDKVKIVIKNFPLSFHPNARPAAKIALAANEQGKYFEMVELLLQNGADSSEAKVKEYAKTLNLNYDRLMKDAKTHDADYEKIITEDLALGEKVDVRGTPTFYINGKKTNARDFNGYKAEIDKILAGK